MTTRSRLSLPISRKLAAVLLTLIVVPFLIVVACK